MIDDRIKDEVDSYISTAFKNRMAQKQFYNEWIAKAQQSLKCILEGIPNGDYKYEVIVQISNGFNAGLSQQLQTQSSQRRVDGHYNQKYSF